MSFSIGIDGPYVASLSLHCLIGIPFLLSRSVDAFSGYPGGLRPDRRAQESFDQRCVRTWVVVRAVSLFASVVFFLLF